MLLVCVFPLLALRVLIFVLASRTSWSGSLSPCVTMMIIFYCYVRWLIPLKKSCQFWKNIGWPWLLGGFWKALPSTESYCPELNRRTIFFIFPESRANQDFQMVRRHWQITFWFCLNFLFSIFISYFTTHFFVSKIVLKMALSISSKFAQSSGHLRRCFQGNQVIMMSQGPICDNCDIWHD